MIKKVLIAAYFVVLFFILGSYFSFSAPELSLHVRVIGSPALSDGYPGAMLIQIDDEQNVLKGMKKRIEVRLLQYRYVDENEITRDLNTPRVISRESYDNVLDGALFKIPYPGKNFDPTNKVGVEIKLYGDDGENEELYKEIWIWPPDARLAWQLQTEAPEFQKFASYERLNQFSVLAPSAFMIGEPNEVLLLNIRDGEPYAGDFVIEQINIVPAPEPQIVHADDSGITSFPLSIYARADFKITAGDEVVYATFVPMERPFHAEITDFCIDSFGHFPRVHVTPSGGRYPIIVDYFVGNVWLDRQIVPAEEIDDFKLQPSLYGNNNPFIVYARLSNSEIPADEYSQMFAFVAASHASYLPFYPEPESEFGLIFHEFNPDFGKTDDFRKKLASADKDAAALARQVAHVLIDHDKTMNDKLSKFRTYLYQHLASKHHTELKAIKDTRREDEYEFKVQKEIYQLKMRAILRLWLIIGVIIFGGVVFHARRRNRLF